MKQSLQQGALKALDAVARAGWLERLERRPDGVGCLRVLTYHRVTPPDDGAVCPGLWSISPEGLRCQLAELASRYQVVSLEQVLACHRGAAALPPRSLLLTFDDGYADFAEHAWPVLRGLSLPAVLFVATAYPDAPERAFWWDRLHCALENATDSAPLRTRVASFAMASAERRRDSLKQLKGWIKRLPHADAQALVDEVCVRLDAPPPDARVLGWNELRRLAGEGLAVCAHTRTHPQLDRVSREVVREEVRGSVADLRRELGAVLPAFAYPDGALDDVVVDVLRDEGIELAFTTGRGVSAFPAEDPLRLQRIPVNARTSDALVRAQLALLRPVRQRARAAP